MSIYDVFSGGSKPFDKAEWAAQKQAQRQEAYELIDNTCSEMMADGESFRQYLDVQGRFDRYSVANAVLVSAQMPDATQLKDYNAWKQSRVYVNKDAQKIVILEPSKEYTRDDGTKAVGYNANIRCPIRIISMVAVICCGRLCGALRDMISGRWVGENSRP